MAIRKSVTKGTLKEVQQAVPREMAYTKGIKKSIEEKIKKAQKHLLQNFEKHPVTIEIAAGPQGTNVSSTLGGIGNLFSYIGFSAGDKPLGPIRIMLKQYDIRFHHSKKKTTINITVPTTTEIFRATPLPWATGRSWAKGIETGISGLGSYLNIDSARSRSGTGIQTKAKQRAGRFKNRTYLSSLLQDYYKEIRKIEQTTIS